MDCNAFKKCPAKIRPETPCWEITREMGDYRYILQICEDCIVYILKEKADVLSKKELHEIIIQRSLLKKIDTGNQVYVRKNIASG